MGINGLGSAFRPVMRPPESSPAQVDGQLQQQPDASAQPAFVALTKVKTEAGGGASGSQTGASDSPGVSLGERTAGKAAKSIDQDLALLSADVYNTEPKAVTGPGGGTWTPVSDADLEAAGIDPALLGTDDTTFKAAVYTDGAGNYVVAYAGTEDLGDAVEDLEQLYGGSEQYDEAVALAQAVTEAYGVDNVVMTGHSLGGGLATLAALVTGTNAVTFNPAGVSDSTFEAHGLDPDHARGDAQDGQVRAYVVEGEILTSTQDSTPFPDTVGAIIAIDDPHPVDADADYLDYVEYGYLNAETQDSIEDHSMDTVLEALDLV